MNRKEEVKSILGNVKMGFEEGQRVWLESLEEPIFHRLRALDAQIRGCKSCQEERKELKPLVEALSWVSEAERGFVNESMKAYQGRVDGLVRSIQESKKLPLSEERLRSLSVVELEAVGELLKEPKPSLKNSEGDYSGQVGSSKEELGGRVPQALEINWKEIK